MKSDIISAGLAAAASISYGDIWSTSTVYSTSVYTVTSCAPEVTDCPARMGQVTTDVVSLYTTICPVTATESMTANSATATASVAPITSEAPWTVSTVYSTVEYTITSCAPEVTNCPVGSKTSTVIASTTSCPVETAASSSVELAPVSSSSVLAVPAYSASKSISQPIASYPISAAPVLSTITISTCVPSYYTSVVTVNPTAQAYPTGGSAGATGSPGVAGAAGSTGTGYPAKSSPSPSFVPVSGAVASFKAGSLMAVFGVIAALL